MALLGSLATGASGVKTQGKSMQVIGNNIANVNTFGFKRNNVAFEDLMGNQYPQGGSFRQEMSLLLILQSSQKFCCHQTLQHL